MAFYHGELDGSGCEASCCQKVKEEAGGLTSVRWSLLDRYQAHGARP